MNKSEEKQTVEIITEAKRQLKEEITQKIKNFEESFNVRVEFKDQVFEEGVSTPKRTALIRLDVIV